MIIVDENLHDQHIMEAISALCPGQVVSVVTLRPGTVIKDEAIPGLLLKAAQLTFVTINVTDFWKKVRPHSGYCIITVALPKERAREVPDLPRRFFLISRPKHYGWERSFAWLPTASDTTSLADVFNPSPGLVNAIAWTISS